MALTLTIENETSLPDGGPLSVTLSGTRGIDIGRDQHLDWCLPDSTRAISGRHCEIRFQDGAYWLRDVSTNGTYVNGGSHRVQSPYRLQNGDKLEIGHYIIAVAIDGAPAQAAEIDEAPYQSAPQPESLWDSGGGEAPPIPRRDLLPPNKLRPVHPGFIDWAADIPAPGAGAFEPSPPPSQPQPQRPDDFAWAPYQTPPVPEPEPIAPIPTPRRPSAPPPAAGDPWNDPAAPAPLPDPEPFQPAPVASAPMPMPMPAGPVSPAEFVQRFAKGLGLPPEALSWQDSGAFAEQLGGLMRLVAVELKLLLAARAESKRIARSTNQTMIQAQDNNPLKFSPTVEDALQLIFGRPTSGYLNAQKAFDESFKDLKIHQIKTYSAMQHALRMLVEDLDPQAVAESVAPEGGLGGLIGSRKAKMWDAYVARWEAKTAPYEDGLVDAFMLYFAECYDRGGRGEG
ncbi:type VI secretion system-associated FHA domain protein TagH [Bosea caraganae]|uniref:Type VI secretion system-associated FHA domain protein TagH n=1 Tax=Bosea caraganae TaxID=2763117 RepID=A0A370L7B7_9HYPH|nr:type VI secretion system-associated FHA domain protein TagH [Bosea caraganae]RDJ24968.1 type VI secretion system-associated FHA domain protein TagH [Bosea caraganae]RDJ26079.1 type VI secretion system-associated FHA domain protein TagH [Bosea caraganae]